MEKIFSKILINPYCITDIKRANMIAVIAVWLTPPRLWVDHYIAPFVLLLLARKERATRIFHKESGGH